MIRTRKHAETVINVIETLKIKEFLNSVNITINDSSWVITDDLTSSIRKYVKAIAENIFVGATITLKTNGIEVKFNNRQSSYISLARGATDTSRANRTELFKHDALKACIQAADTVFSGAILTESSPSDSNYAVTFDARSETIRSYVKGNYNYCMWLRNFHESLSIYRNALHTLMTSIPDIQETLRNLQEMIRMETRRRQAAAISDIDSIIASITGIASTPEPEPEPITISIPVVTAAPVSDNLAYTAIRVYW